MQKSYTQVRLTELDEPFRTLMSQLLELGYKNGMCPQISAGYRSPEEQDALYARGRTTKGPRITNARRYESLHQYRIAADVFFLDAGGKADYTENLFRTLWNLACKAGLDREGLHWSGLWQGSLRESAHFQLGRPDWRELARAAGIDPVTKNKLPK